MNDSFSSNLDPDAGFEPVSNPTPSISKAADDLRVAAGEKAREIAHSAEVKASTLKEKAMESAQKFRTSATEQATALKSSATEQANQFRECATEQWENTRDRAKEFQVTAEDYIRQNPTKSILCAIGAGFLIGLLVRR